MKKLILIAISFLTIINIQNNNKEDEIIIPNSAIRLRVIPNSNNIEDQSMKSLVKDKIEDIINDYLLELENIEDARNKIIKSINNMKIEIDKIFEENNYNIKYTIEFGQNYFPKKEYKGITYKEGNYESLVITIGKGQGDNWWCVLFPPLCLLEKTNSTEIEYKFWVKELIDKIF